MHQTTLNTDQSRLNTHLQSTRDVRTMGAPDALGFAQVMQAFEFGSESSLAESIAQSQDADDSGSHETEELVEQGDDLSSDTTDQASSQGDGSASSTDQSTDDDSATQTQSENGTQSTDIKSAADQSSASLSTDQLNSSSSQMPGTQVEPVAQVPVEGTVEDESAFRLLESQGDQAKLSIKGLIRSMTQSADADLTAIAVDTQMGRAPRGQADQATHHNQQLPTQPQDRGEKPVSGSPRPTLEAVPQHQTQPAITPPNQTDAMKADQPARHRPQVSIEVDASLRVEGEQAKHQAPGRQVDAASIAGQSRPSEPVVSTASKQLAGLNASQSRGVTRVVTSVESSNIGNQQADTNPGSLVEKLKSSELPSPTRRAEVMAQVQRGLASLLRSGNNEMVLKLMPEHLGEVRIQLKTQGDRISVRFNTTSPQATEHLNASVKELGVNLVSKGMVVESIEVRQTADHAQAHSENGNDHTGDQGRDRHQDQSQGQSNDQSNQSSHSQLTDQGFEDLDLSEESSSIWTQLGLDATA